MRLSRVITGLLRFLQFDGRANVQAATGEQKAHTYENAIYRSLAQPNKSAQFTAAQFGASERKAARVQTGSAGTLPIQSRPRK